MFLGSERQELFMPELGAFRIRETSHGMDDSTLSFGDVVDLTDEPDDLRHLVPKIIITCALSKVTDSGPLGPIAKQDSGGSGKAATTPGLRKP